MLIKVADNTPENNEIAYKIVLKGLEMSHFFIRKIGKDPDKDDIVNKAIDKLGTKMYKVAEEKFKFSENFRTLEKELINLNEEDLPNAVGTHKLAGNIENFLTQGKGALVLLTNQFLNSMVGFKGRWNHKKILKYLTENDFNQEIVEMIKALLERSWNEWLKDFVDDRNLHHSDNFGLTPMYLIEGKPAVTLTRFNGDVYRNVSGYLEFNWLNLVLLVEKLMHLSFCLIEPPFARFLKGYKFECEFQ